MNQKDKIRFEEIHDAVSHGAVEHEPKIAADLMFLCGLIQSMFSDLSEVYGKLVDELDTESCMGNDGVSYASADKPGDCGCRTCSLHHISDMLHEVMS